MRRIEELGVGLDELGAAQVHRDAADQLRGHALGPEEPVGRREQREQPLVRVGHGSAHSASAAAA